MAASLVALPGLDEDLSRVEERLLTSAEADDPFLTEVASHLIRAGGKRARPAFAIAAAACGMGDDPGPATDDVVMGAVSVELVHLGSLYHDDVIDDATTRRAVDSVNARWGNLKAILAGDFLLARASEIAAGLGTEVAGLLAATISRLCEGQVRELQDVYNVARTEDAYLTSIGGKTAELFASACRIGAIVGGLDRPQIESLTEFGREFGMAFQIIDDVLDVVATEEQLGKPSGHDLVEGVYTLPVIRLLSSHDGDGLAEMLGKPLDDEERERARALVMANGIIPDSLATARGYAASAGEALTGIGNSAAAEALRSSTGRVLQRVEALAAS